MTDLAAVPGDTQVELSWVNPTDVDFDHVTVVYLAGSTAPANPGDGTPVTLGSPTATGVTVTGLVNGQDYTFAVFAYDAAGNPSVPASVTSTPIGAGEVAPVTNLQAAGAGSGSVVLTWTNPSQLDGIIVRYSTTEAPAGPTDGTGVGTPGTPETVTVGGLADGTTYYFLVFARLGSAVSTPESVTWAPYTCPNLAPR